MIHARNGTAGVSTNVMGANVTEPTAASASPMHVLVPPASDRTAASSQGNSVTATTVPPAPLKTLAPITQAPNDVRSDSSSHYLALLAARTGAVPIRDVAAALSGQSPGVVGAQSSVGALVAEDACQNRRVTGKTTYTNPLKPSKPVGCRDWECTPETTGRAGADYAMCCRICSGLLLCSKPEVSACPPIGEAKAVGARFESTDQYERGQPLPLTCEYDLCSVVAGDVRDINTWRDTFGEDRAYDEEIMPDWCARTVTACPSDPLTGLPMARCSRFVSTGPDGAHCRGRAAKNVAAADAAKLTYCTVHNTPDCSCLNRRLNPVYDAVSKAYAVEDRCWWKPCQDSISALVPSTYSQTNCPTTLCQTVINVIDSEKIDLDDVTQYITCSAGGGTGGGGGTQPAPGGGGGKGGGGSPPPSPGLSTTTIVLLVLGGVLALLAVGALFYFVFMPKSPASLE